MNNQISQGNETTPKYKSVKLLPKEISALKKEVAKHPNQEVAAKAIGLNHRRTLSNIMRLGCGSSDSIAIIREKLKPVA